MSQRSLQECFAVVVGSEGGLSLVPKDRGNWTGGVVGAGTLAGSKYGVSAARYPFIDIENLTEADAFGYFDRDYFTPNHCHQMPGPLALLVSDTAYNGGFPLPWMQKSMPTYHGLIDGDWGPKSIAAAELISGDVLRSTIVSFLAQRMNYLVSLDNFKSNPGWITRVIGLTFSSVEITD